MTSKRGGTYQRYVTHKKKKKDLGLHWIILHERGESSNIEMPHLLKEEKENKQIHPEKIEGDKHF